MYVTDSQRSPEAVFRGLRGSFPAFRDSRESPRPFARGRGPSSLRVLSRSVLWRGGAQGRAAAIDHIPHAAGQEHRQRDQAPLGEGGGDLNNGSLTIDRCVLNWIASSVLLAEELNLVWIVAWTSI